MTIIMRSFVSLLCVTLAAAQSETVRATVSLMPLYPDDGAFSGVLANRYVFLKHDGETVVSYARPDGSRVDMPIVFPNRVKADLTSNVEAEAGSFRFTYRLKGVSTSQGALKLFLTVPRTLAVTGPDDGVNAEAWERTDVEFGPLGEGVGWCLRRPSLDGLAWSGELLVRDTAKPGMTAVFVSGQRNLSGKWEDLPRAARDEIESLERTGLGAVQMNAIGPKFPEGTHPYIIVHDYHEQIEILVRSGRLPSSPFIAQVQSELMKYMDAVRATGIELLEDIQLRPTIALTERPASPLEEMIGNALKLSLELPR